MSLNIEIERWLKSRPEPSSPSSISELRAQVNQDIVEQQGIELDGHYQQQFFISTTDDAEIEVRMYIPYSLVSSTQRPAMVFAHGGGWCLGSLDAWDRCCRLLAESAQQVIFSVDYRLAPEVKFPIPLNDYFSALSYIQKNASVFGLDPNYIAVAGDSAGANIAAASCILAKQHPEIKISHQWLFYPALDATMSSPSYKTYADGLGLTAATMTYCWAQYLNGESDKTNELVSPLLAESLHDLPDATIFICEYDPLRDDAERFAERLESSGSQVTRHFLKGMIHGALHMTAISSEVKAIYQRVEPIKV